MKAQDLICGVDVSKDTLDLYYNDVDGREHYLKVSNDQKGQPSTSKEALARVRQPVLVISGDKDTDNGPAAELAKLLPHATLNTVTGDHSQTIATSAFSNAVLRFLKQKSD